MIPSEEFERYWIYSINESYKFKKSKAERRSGKWLIFDTVKKIDSIWLLIDEQTKNGKLGPSAKVSTSKPNKNATEKTSRVICVFTENYDDKDDLSRIISVLREMGIKNRLLYKLDEDVGKYEKDGHKNLIKLKSYCQEFKELAETFRSKAIDIEENEFECRFILNSLDIGQGATFGEAYLNRLGFKIQVLKSGISEIVIEK